MPSIALRTGVGTAIGLSGNAPPAPESLSAEATAQTTATVTWADEGVYPDNSTSFRVEISDDGDTWGTAGTVSASPFNDTGLSAGTTYLYRVIAINFWGESQPSTTAQVETPSVGPPAAPSGLMAVAQSPTTVAVSWTDNADNETGFELERDIVNTFNDDPQVFEPGADDVAYLDTGLDPETTYYYRVRAVNGAGNSSYSSTANATTEAEGSPVFGLTPHDTGITADIGDWFSDETARLGRTPGVNDWWLWQLGLWDYESNNDPALVVVQHRDPAGARIYANDGTFGFTDATAGMGVNYYDLTMAGGATLFWDFNGDAHADYCGYGSTYGQNEWHVNDGDGTISLNPNNSGDGPQQTIAQVDWYYLCGIGNLAGNGRCDLEITRTPTQSSLTANRYLYTANGSGWFTRTAGTKAPPAGLSAGQLSDLAQYTYPTVTSSFMQIRFIPFDLEGTGAEDDYICQVFGSYDGPSACRIYQNNGDDTYTDRTTEWGLPDDAYPLIVRQWPMPLREEAQPDSHLHQTGAGSGRPSLFFWKRPSANSVAGYYVWNGSGYTRQASDALTTRLSALTTEVYAIHIYAVDWTNAGHLDYYLMFPRGGQGYLFLNDGAGAFSLYAGTGTGTGGVIQGWDGYAHVIHDLDGDGLIDLAVGGNASGGGNGGTSGTTAKVCSVLENTTTDAGHWLRVKTREPSGYNRFAVGGKVEIFAPNGSTVLRRWKCHPGGLPVHFGCGSRTTVDVKVTWPDATTTLQEDVSTNQLITITKGA